MSEPQSAAKVLDLRANLLDILTQVPDPEIPVINIVELGIVRDVRLGKPPQIIITPTYTGCPATYLITQMIREKLDEYGHQDVDIKSQLAPVWTTDWITDAAKTKLKAYGIDPPALSKDKNALATCPRCSSTNSELISEFGSTPCKSLYACKDCLEPFDRFKCH
ncbi:MAG: 1,2-phenylacetyl-CoA epoxidase subunit PaaD [Robiginitomaculum sp.]